MDDLQSVEPLPNKDSRMYFFRNVLTYYCLVQFIVFGSGTPASASITASDSAADAAYDDGWNALDNGGFGFFPWTLNNTGPNSGHFVFTSTENGDGDSNGDGDIDTVGRAWGMFANSGELAEAFRGFSSPLSAGDTFQVSMDIGFIENDSVDLMALRNFGGDNRMELLFIGGQNTFLINDSVTGFDTGIPFTDEGLEIAVRITGSDSYDVTITELASGTINEFLNRTFAGTGEITNFRGANVNAGSDAARNVYFNSLSIDRQVVPEMASLIIWSSLVCAGSAASLFKKWARNR